MRYLARFSLNPGNLGAAAHKLLRPDSIFDPDASGVGHQPRGHDQLTPLYKKYRVTACKMKFKFGCQTNTAVNYAVGATIRRDGATQPDITDYVEGGPYTKWRYLSSEGQNGAFFSLTYRPRILFGKSWGDDDFALVGANPATTAAYCHVWAAPAGSNTADAQTVYVDVLMDFWIQLAEAAPVGQS